MHIWAAVVCNERDLPPICRRVSDLAPTRLSVIRRVLVIANLARHDPACRHVSPPLSHIPSLVSGLIDGADIAVVGNRREEVAWSASRPLSCLFHERMRQQRRRTSQ